MATTQSSNDVRVELRDLFDRHFAISDLKTLAFDLGINYGNIAGETQRNKFEYLIMLMGSQNRLPELLEKASEINPGVRWPDVDWSTLDWPDPESSFFELTISRSYEIEETLISYVRAFREPMPLKVLLASSRPISDSQHTLSNTIDVNNEIAVIQDFVLKLLVKSDLKEKFDVQLFEIDETKYDASENRFFMRLLVGSQSFASDTKPLPEDLSQFDLIILVIWHNLGFKDVILDIFQKARKVGEASQLKKVFVLRRNQEVQLSKDIWEKEKDAHDHSNIFFQEFSQRAENFVSYPPERFEQTFESVFRDFLGMAVPYHKKREDLIKSDREGEKGRQTDDRHRKRLDQTRIRNPYRGLSQYEIEHASLFFGRIDEVDDLRDKLANQQTGLLAVVGPSGSGKSSIVRAGLLHRLGLGAIPGSRDWLTVEYRIDVEEEDQLEAIAFELSKIKEKNKAINKPRRVLSFFSSPEEFEKLVDMLLDDRPPHSRLCFFFDQFEEVFTLIKDEKSQQTLVDFVTMAAASSRVKVIIAVRSDFYHRCIRFSGLKELFKKGTYPLAFPEKEALENIIIRPAIYNGFSFENNDLPHRILEDAGPSHGSLPLISYTLEQLVEQALKNQRTVMKYEDYTHLGEVGGIIEKTASEAIFPFLEDENFESSFKAIFRELVTFDDSGIVTKRPALIEHIPENAQPIVEVLVAKRLLQAGKTDNNEPTVQIIHEALLHNWDRLEKWIDLAKSDLLTLKKVETAAREWLEARQAIRRAAKPKSQQIEELAIDRQHLWPHERLRDVDVSLNNLGMAKSSLPDEVQKFLQPEADRLIEELKVEAVNHGRRAEIGDRLAFIGDPRPGIGLEADHLPQITWCKVPAGKTIMILEPLGQNSAKTNVEKVVDHPFYIAKYPVTLAQFNAFVGNLEGETAYKNDEWWQGFGPGHDKWFNNKPAAQLPDLPNRPANLASWYQAVAFTRWLTAEYHKRQMIPEDQMVRLPTEWEWQLAASGGLKNHNYPWGSEWDSGRVSSKEGIYQLVAVGMYPHGQSPIGALDMSGNAYEWCLNAFDDLNNLDVGDEIPRVTKGGAYFTHAFLKQEVKEALRIDSRLRDQPSGFNDRGDRISVTFRLMCEILPEGAEVKVNPLLFPS